MPSDTINPANYVTCPLRPFAQGMRAMCQSENTRAQVRVSSRAFRPRVIGTEASGAHVERQPLYGDVGRSCRCHLIRRRHLGERRNKQDVTSVCASELHACAYMRINRLLPGPVRCMPPFLHTYTSALPLPPSSHHTLTPTTHCMICSDTCTVCRQARAGRGGHLAPMRLRVPRREKSKLLPRRLDPPPLAALR